MIFPVSVLCPWALLLWLGAPRSEPAPVAAIADALRAHQFEQALQLSTGALRSSPQDFRLWTLNAFAAQGLKNEKSALESYRRALALAPDYMPALKGKAQLEYDTGNPEAARTLRLVLRQVPDDQVSHGMLGAISFKSGDCKTAVAEYQAAESAIDSQPGALSQYGECLLKTGQREKAMEVLRRASSLRPDDYQFKYNLALAELESGNSSAALAAIAPLLDPPRLAQTPADVLDLASAIYESENDTPRAVAVLRQAIVQNPADTDLYLHFANLCFVHKSFPVGIDMLTVGLSRVPGSARLYAARGVLFVQMGRYEQAGADFDRANQIDPNQSFGSLAQGLTQLQQSKFDQALTTTEAELKRSPGDSFLYYLKAETLNRRGLRPGSADMRQAIAAAREAVRLRPDFPLAKDLLGSLYLKAGETDLARKQFEEAVRRDAGDQSALYHLMLMAKGAGRRDEALALMKKLAEAKARAQRDDAKVSKYHLVEAGKAF